MGCWGITAFESDDGLDAVGVIKRNLPHDGKLELKKIIETMRKNEWCVPSVADCNSHTGPMALAEIVVKFLDQDIKGVNHHNYNQFHSVTSFIASKESILWLRDYISDSLQTIQKNAESRAKHALREEDKWGGWFKEKNWLDWQSHMSTLIGRLDALLDLPENQIEIIHPQEKKLEQTREPVMSMTM